MIFDDRADAGRQLAGKLQEFAGHKDAIVLGIPRGGVVVAAEIARALHLPLDIFLSHKLGVPWQPELAFGAIAANGARFLDHQMIRSEGISAETINRLSAETQTLLNDRAARYRGNRPLPELAGQTAILIDDGIATGASAFAAIQALRQQQPAQIVLAAPVAPRSTAEQLRRAADRFVCLFSPDSFFAVGQFYRDFSQTSDEQVTELLSET